MTVLNKANTNYDPFKREPTTADVYHDQRPSVSYEEQLVSLRLLDNARADAASVKPPIANIGMTAPRFGYRIGQPDILDVLSVDDIYTSKFGDYSGTSGQGYSGSSFPSLPQT
jgi:hypothetical protein